ncbi:MAG: ElyC/SanA/YdcF family protein [Verrucomicrobiales bacterium]|nr:ElyC/SanA/YdcF family protein [Verrucomicrobiales bacterium]
MAVASHGTPGASKESSRKPLGKYLLRFFGRILIAGSVFVFLLAILFLFRAPLCKSAAKAWIAGSALEQNYDIAIIPGGGLQTRPFAAADLFHQGKVDGLVSFLTEVMPAEQMGLTRPADEVTLEILDQLEVPREKIHIIGDHVTSTQDEVLAVKKWALKNEIKSLVVLTEIFPSRRAAHVYEREFKGTGITTEVFALSPGSYSADNWWQHEQGLITFQNEVIKYFYYLLKY